MKSFQEECLLLDPLQTFDPAAFTGDEEFPQGLCSFILALALVFNEVKDIAQTGRLLRSMKPEGKFYSSRTWGTYAGMDWHVFRLICSSLHELFNMIERNESLLAHDAFKKLIKNLNPKARRAWQTLVSVALTGKPKSKKNELAKTLLLIRNKVAYHLDPECIYKGYRGHFYGMVHGPSEIYKSAFISFGTNMAATRFYFADAAALGYLRSLAGPGTDIVALERKIYPLIEPLILSLCSMVDTFINLRGHTYQSFSEKSS